MGTMTVIELAQALDAWEWDNGENVLEDRFGSSFDESEYMKWCLENGKIDHDKYDLFLEEYAKDYGDHEIHQVVFDDMGDFPYAVVTTDHLFDEDGMVTDNDEFVLLKLKAYEIFADYVLTFDDGQTRWEDFVANGEW